MITEPIPIASIAIPAYEEKEYIYDCLANLEKQSIFHLCEVSIGDYDPDNTRSTRDEVLRYVKQRSDRYKNKIRVIRVRRKGIGYARNVAANFGKAPVIASFDADTKFTHDNALERLVLPVFNGEYYWSCCQNYLEDRSYPAANAFYDLGNILTEHVPVACEPGLTISRFAFQQAGGFADTSLFEGRILDLKLSALYGLNKRLYLTDVGVFCSNRRIKHMRPDNFFEVFNYEKAYRNDRVAEVQ